MLDSDRRWHVRMLTERAVWLARDLDHLVGQLKGMRAGYPSGGVGGPSGSGSSQPERLACEPDPASLTIARLDRLVDRVSKDLAEVDSLRLSTLPRRGAAALGDEGCRSCARVSGRWSPVHRAGRCRWCYDRSAELGQDPPALAVEWMLDGRRVTIAMMRDALAAERSDAASRRRKKRHARKIGSVRR